MLRNIRPSYFSLNWKKNLSMFLISHLQQLSAMETILYLNSISKPSQSTKWNFQKPTELEVQDCFNKCLYSICAVKSPPFENNYTLFAFIQGSLHCAPVCYNIATATCFCIVKKIDKSKEVIKNIFLIFSVWGAGGGVVPLNQYIIFAKNMLS